MDRSMKAHVIIPSYRRASDLGHVLSCLSQQTVKPSKVTIVLKPSGDGSETIIRQFTDRLSLEVIYQVKGGFVDALNLGLKNVKGDIAVFLDDDITFGFELIDQHLSSYSGRGIGGIAGAVIPEGSYKHNVFSDVVYRPIKGLEGCAYWISRSGMICYNDLRRKQNSILGRGANFSVLASAVAGFKFPAFKFWNHGTGNEQILSWHLKKKGFRILYDPAIKVFHSQHDSLSRNKQDKSLILERSLNFHRLRDLGVPVRWRYRIAFLTYDFLRDIIHRRVEVLPTKLHGELLGLSNSYRKSE
jgi:glycosyltransferase involved in cell wall biosynthesis